MKKLFLLVCITLVLLTACEELSNEPIDPNAECNKDADCIKSGCSSTICQSSKAEDTITTCEYKPEYDCYKQITCGCNNGKCGWETDAEYDQCVTNARSQQSF